MLRPMLPAMVIGFAAFAAPYARSQGSCIWLPLADGTSHAVFSLAVFDDGNGPALYAGGHLVGSGNVPANGIARWDGSAWSAVGSGIPGGIVYALTAFDDGSGPALYAAGTFSIVTSAGTTAWNIAKWNGLVWSALGTGTNGTALSLATFDAGYGPGLYVGGYFTLAGGATVNRIARWTGGWSAVDGGVGGPGLPSVNALAVHDDGSGPQLFAAGSFATAGSTPGAVNSIARWDGWNWSSVGNGFYNRVSALASYLDSSGPGLYAGGDFTLSEGSPGDHIARWNGSGWAPVGTGITGVPAIVRSLAVFDEGSGPSLYVGGVFNSAGGVSAKSIARWNGGAWSNLSGGLPNEVNCLAVFADATTPALFAGGSFSSGGTPLVKNLARWSCGAPIALALKQPGPAGSAMYIVNANLTPGRAYYNLFSFEPCPAGVGQGPWLGLCAANPSWLISQFLLPLGAAPIHFTAPSSSSYVLQGPFYLPPTTLEAVCFDWDGSKLGPVSKVVSLTTQ